MTLLRAGTSPGICTQGEQGTAMLPAARGCEPAEVPGIDAGGSAGAERVTPQLSRGQQRPRDQCGVKEIRLRTRGFYSFLPHEKLGFMDFW